MLTPGKSSIKNRMKYVYRLIYLPFGSTLLFSKSLQKGSALQMEFAGAW